MARILVVEDNEPSRDVLARRLERRGYDVVATDGGEAVSAGHVANDFDTTPVRFEPLLEKISALLAKRELVR